MIVLVRSTLASGHFSLYASNDGLGSQVAVAKLPSRTDL